MKTKVITCGKYDCVHCASEGRCYLKAISITPEGKCAQYKHPSSEPKQRFSELDTHTNMC